MTPGPARFERIVELVDGALALPSAERSAFLDASCEGDAGLRAEVESLLRYEDRAHGLIRTEIVRAQAQSLLDHGEHAVRGGLNPGDALGEYRIVSLLGEGGMGAVYLAADSALDGRQVAIKLIKHSFVSESLLRHFRQERLILSRLNHPHIAQLYGGGVTADGVPFFVLEYVEGEPIHVYCDRLGLTFAARLAIFRKVCAAVAYAHRRLIVHRDIKPANIRVTPEGEPKLLDFGIARLLADPQTGAADPERTATLFDALTPAYASPEQLRGEDVTTSTDIYSLGVLLYELLSGRRPHAIGDRKTSEAIRAICEQPVERPSLAASRLDPAQQAELARARGVSPARWVRQMSGDLDNIILTAMRKEPERRYASVDAMSADLQNHLDGRPVTARRETWRYVGAKFIRRNKAAAAIAALLLLSLVGGIAAISWQARRAERRFQDVRRLADSLLFEIHDSVQPLAGSTPTRRLIVSRALEYLDRLSGEADTPELRRDLANAYEKIGDIQGNPYAANLGDTDGALASYRKAETLRLSLPGKDTLETGMALGRSCRALGDILELKGDYDGMIGYYRRSSAIFQDLYTRFPGDRDACDEYARANDVLGDGLDRIPNGGPERLACYERSLELRTGLLRAAPGDVKFRRAAATASCKIGLASMPDKARAVESISEGVKGFRALSAEQPDNSRARRDLTWGLFSLGNVLAEAGDYAAALEVRAEILPIREAIAAADPKNTQAQFDLAATHTDLAEALTGCGDPSKAIDHARRANEIMAVLQASDPANIVYERNTSLVYKWTGLAHSALASKTDDPANRLEQWTKALSWLEKADALFSDLRTRKALRPNDAARMAELHGAAARCREEIAKARNTPVR